MENIKDVKYEVHWLNLPTGAQLNSEILANRLDIVSMADFPSIVGHDAFLTQNNGVKTVYIASLSSGLRGAGNALLVPEASSVQSIEELKGKMVSVPFASTAHAFLLRAVKNQGWDPETDITIVTQTPEVGRFGSQIRPDRCPCEFRAFRGVLPVPRLCPKDSRRQQHRCADHPW